MKKSKLSSIVLSCSLAASTAALAQTYTLEAENFTTTGGTYDGFQTYSANGLSGGSAVNYVQTGDWGDYLITVADTGYYKITASLATPLTNAGIKTAVSGNQVAEIDVPSTGGWGAFQDVVIANNIYLTANSHLLRFEGAGTNWEWNADKFTVELVQAENTGGATSGDTVLIEAEDFNNTGGTYDGFETYTNTGLSGGGAVNFVQTGDWGDYLVTAPATGNYTIKAKLATPLDNAAIKASVSGFGVGTKAVPNTGGWGTFEDVTIATGVYLTAQAHTLRFEGAGTNWEWNADSFELVYEGTGSTPGNGGTGVSVNVNLDVNHKVGAFDSMDRTRFITMHATHNEQDWHGNNAQSLNAPNGVDDLMKSVLNDRDVYLGRDTGGMAFWLSQATESATNPGWADPTYLLNSGAWVRDSYTNGTDANTVNARQYAWRDTRLIVGAQQRPYYSDGQKATGQGWTFSSADTAAEPFGTAAGNYIGQYVNKFFRPRNDDSIAGQQKPMYVEIMNEPVFELVEHPHAGTTATTIEQVMDFHKNARAAIREQDSEVKIGGYATAFPNYEVGDFNEWFSTDKLFMDTTGWAMDFISVHLYDFPNFPDGAGGFLEQYRKGSNMEATLDMLEGYMDQVWGNRLPIVISEFGSQLQGSFNQPWTAERDWLQVKAFSPQLLQFLERPDRIEQAIPFIPLKAEWGRISEDIPYYWRLMIQNKERPGQTGEEWVFSDLIYFYDLWNGVSGKRVDTWSEDPDIMVDAYVNGNTVYFIASNLEFENKALDLSFLGANGNNISSVGVRHAYMNANGSTGYSVTNHTSLPSSVTVNAESTMVVVAKYDNNVTINHTNEESKHYCDVLTTPITANQTISCQINSVDVASNGEAILRIGVGRDFGRSLQPTVTINGTPISVPTDYRGYDQNLNGRARNSFFGVIEVPVPYSALRQNNTVNITFSDTGGRISTVALQNFQFSKAISRQ